MIAVLVTALGYPPAAVAWADVLVANLLPPTLAIVALGSTAGMVKDTVGELREAGKKVGLLKLRSFRPFPDAEIAAALKNCKAVAVMDRAISFGAMAGCGPLFLDLTSALYNLGVRELPVVNYIYGLGGRDTMPSDIESAFADLQKIADTGTRGALTFAMGLLLRSFSAAHQRKNALRAR